MANQTTLARRSTWIESSLASGGLSQVLVRLESRLPVLLMCTKETLESGEWQCPPPKQIAAHTAAVWHAVAEGVIGTGGVLGNVEYTCEWNGRKGTFSVNFEGQVFAPRKFRCEEVCTPGDAMFILQCESGGAGASTGVVEVRVGLREDVDSHAVIERTKTGFPAGFMGGSLSATLNQAPRSLFLRVVNLTKSNLVLNRKEANPDEAHGFWVSRPPDKIQSISFHDIGIAAGGILSSVYGALVYKVDGTMEEGNNSIIVTWTTPWVGKKMVTATCAGVGKYVVEAHKKIQSNLVCVVHVINPHNIPPLEVLDVRCLVAENSKDSSNTESSNLTHCIRQEMSSSYDLELPSVRAFLSHVASRQGANVDTSARLMVLYRIGPEIFSHVFKPSEQVSISSALPGGNGKNATVFSALEAKDLVIEGQCTSENVLNTAQRAMRCQQIFTEAMWPLSRKALQNALGIDWQTQVGISAQNMWPKVANRPNEGHNSEPDAEALLDILAKHWAHVAGTAGAQLDHLLVVQTLATTWAQQKEIDEELIINATSSAATLLESFGLQDAAKEQRGLCPRKMELPTQKVKSRQSRWDVDVP